MQELNDITYQSQSDEIITNYINTRFIRAWRGEVFHGNENYNGLELIVDPKCNLACKYCYYDKYYKDYFPKGTSDRETILANAKSISDALVANKLFPEITLFSGDITYRSIAIELVEQLSGFIKSGGLVTIPTNATFLTNEEQTKKMEEVCEKYKILLSLSVEGKYCEHSRPYKGMQKEIRDDAYYDRVFKFAKKFNFGFHPMIHASNIRNWKDNIDWYLDMFKKYDIPPYALYLLEVRNNDWTNEDIIIYGEFIEYLVHKVFKFVCNSDHSKFLEFLFEQHGMNTLSNIFFSVGRGITCSIQSTLGVRLGDMSIFPCHRLAYPWFEIGKLKVPEFKVYDVKKAELMLGVHSADVSNFPGCDYCMINKLCSGCCLGQQYESSYDLFYPDRNVCRLLHMKIRSLLKAYKDLDMLHHILTLIKNPETLNQVLAFCEVNNI